MGPRSQRFLDAETPEGHDGPLRLCAATRTSHSIDELIRFVAGPDGEIVPDLARRLPGRGVWVLGTRAALERAVAGRVFAKSLKRSVKVPDDLANRVEAQLVARAQSALSIANKAGLVVTGAAKIDATLDKGVVAVLVHGSDAAPGGCEKLDRKYAAIAKAAGREPIVVTDLTIEQMSLAMGGANVVHAALEPGGATDKLVSEAGRLRRFRPQGSVSAANFGCPTQVETD